MKHPVVLSILLGCMAAPGGLIASDGPSYPQVSTSEEYPPITCPANEFVAEVFCEGSYCDFVGVTCRPVQDALGARLGVFTGSRMHTAYTSDEDRRAVFCPGGYGVTGLTCTGRYCDNISLECGFIQGATTGNCGWSRVLSEETPPIGTGAQQVIVGLQCSGDYCDNKAFLSAA